MEIKNDNDFKYIIQDTNFVYFGKELTYTEMLDNDDVPFKFKAIISSYVSKDTDLNLKLSDHILRMSDNEFSQRIYEQLKMTVRVCYKTTKKGFGGRVKEKWVHKACPLKKLGSEYRNEIINGNMMIEDISISKLALMAISI
jgi:hypothetical protein